MSSLDGSLGYGKTENKKECCKLSDNIGKLDGNSMHTYIFDYI